MRTYYLYLVENKINGKYYIGQTVDFDFRKWTHERCYEKDDCYFHRAIKKYGKENFEWTILGTVYKKETADRLEKEFIKAFDCYKPKGYNMTKGGDGGSMWNAIPVVCLELDGTYVKRYDSASETEIDGYHCSDVLISCKFNNRTSKGCMFMFEDEYLSNGAKKYEKKEVHNVRKVVQCDMSGNFIAEYKSLQEASKITGARRTTISGVLNGNYKSANGFIFVYKEDFPIKDISRYKPKKKGIRIQQIEVSTGEVINTFERIADAGRELGVNYKAIHKVVDKEERTAYGYKWKSIS